jgi:hypothetical protein
MSAAGKTSAANRALKKGKRNKRSTDVQQTLNDSSTTVEHATILSSTILLKENSGEKERANVKSADPLPFTSQEFALAVERWERHRSELRHKLTPEARAAWLRKCEAMGEARSIAAIDHSIANGWQGMFEPKAEERRPQPSSGSVPPMDRNAPVTSKLFRTFEQKQQA